MCVCVLYTAACGHRIPESRVDNDGVFYVGSALSGSEKFTGLMQDFRLFNRKLTSV